MSRISCLCLDSSIILRVLNLFGFFNLIQCTPLVFLIVTVSSLTQKVASLVTEPCVSQCTISQVIHRLGNRSYRSRVLERSSNIRYPLTPEHFGSLNSNSEPSGFALSLRTTPSPTFWNGNMRFGEASTLCQHSVFSGVGRKWSFVPKQESPLSAQITTSFHRSRRFSLRPATGNGRGIAQAKVARLSATGDEKLPWSTLILLAGGVGKRMGALMPKQYLPLHGKPIALHSFQTFLELNFIKEVVVVCEEEYRDIFQSHQQNLKDSIPLKFASPGKERQDSVFNGLRLVSADAMLVCIHDSARPLITCEEITSVVKDAATHGAAVLGVACKPTIKEVDEHGFVVKTLDRSKLWEMQTPQVIAPEILRKGFDLVQRESLDVTDDVSIVEHLGMPVKVTRGYYTNIKVTTPDDMFIAERFLEEDTSVL